MKGAGGHTVMGDLHAVMLGGSGYRDAFLDVLVVRDEQVPPCWLLMRAHLFIHSRFRVGLCVRMTVWTATIRKKRRPVQHQPDHQGDIDPGRQAALWIIFCFALSGMADRSISIRVQCSTEAWGCEDEQRIFYSE